IPAAAAFLGLAFMLCTLVIAGLPPMSGFVGKVAMLTALLNPTGLGAPAGPLPGPLGWTLLALMIGTGLLALIALTRSGIRHFWASHDRAAPPLQVLEGTPIALLLAGCVLLTIQAGPVMNFTLHTAQALHAPGRYVHAVMSAIPKPNPPAMPLSSPKKEAP
ncbi:MAG: cation:proton antiporter, partial [Giesbergeria sp.]|nr:cation:proton antiporter [Giesbergeria sp.]